MSGILTAVDEMSGILLKVGEMLGKNLVREKWFKTVLLAAYLHPFLSLLSLCLLFRFQIMHCCISTSTTDNNTSSGMI